MISRIITGVIVLVVFVSYAFAQTLLGTCSGTVTVQSVGVSGTGNVYCTQSCAIPTIFKYSNPCNSKFHTGMFQ